jgi:tetratricopeptide (TPR) repeat protein
LRWKAKRIEAATPADLLKDIDKLRDTLDEVGESDLAKRADVLHSITENILTYLRVSKNRDPRDSNFLLSIAVGNVTEEVKIMNDLRQQRASTLYLFASTMWARFMTGGDVRFMDQAISHFQKALGVDNRHEASMFELATALWMRFTRYNQLQDLNEVVMLYRALLFNRSPNNPNVVEWLNGIGLALWERYKRTKAMNDMDHAISYLRRASISYPAPCDPFTLSNLGNILMAKARAFKDTSESDEAIVSYRKALNSVTPLHPNRSAFLSNLGDALCYRYERRFVLADLNEAIRCYERALELPAPHHRDRIASLKLCADKLHLRWNRTADVEDLELAVKHYQEAKRQAHPQHPKYASVTEALILAQRDLENCMRHRSDYASPPPSSQPSPVMEHSPVPMLRPTSWSTTPVTHPVASTTPYRTVPKYRIVSRSHTMKPYTRPRRDSSSESDAGNVHGFPHHRAKSPVPKSPLSSFNRSPQHHPKRHHTMPGMPTGIPL